jgi:hypothetical protein
MRDRSRAAWHRPPTPVDPPRPGDGPPAGHDTVDVRMLEA